LSRPVQAASGLHHGRTGALLRLTDEHHRIGWGEATPLGTVEGAARLDEAATGLVGLDVADSVDAIERCVASVLGPELPASRYALELALLDLLGQARRLPIARLLSPGARDRVSANALLSGSSSAEIAEEGLKAVASGFGTLKLKVGALTGGEDVARLAALRRAVGASARIRLDANGVWSRSQAEAALWALRPLDLELVEQPVGLEDVASLAVLKGLGLCRIAADESLSDSARAREILYHQGGPAVDVVVLKPMVLGGLLPSLRLARAAHEVGVDAYVTHSLDGPVARAGAAHLGAAIPQSGLACGVCQDEDAAPFEARAFFAKQGEISIPAIPGLGVALRMRGA
jgi:o-succinylbenzoate synthase